MNLSVILCFGIGIVFLAAAVAVVLKIRKDTEECNVSTTAHVIGFSSKEIEDHDMDSHITTKTTYLFPIFEFTCDGRRITVTSTTGDPKTKFKKGQEVELYYDPSNPERYYVPEEVKSLKIVAAAMTAVSVVLIVIGCIIK